MRVAMLSTGTTAGVRAQAEGARLLGQKERLPAKGAAAQKQRRRAEGRERRRSQPAPACGGPRELRAAYARRPPAAAAAPGSTGPKAAPRTDPM